MPIRLYGARYRLPEVKGEDDETRLLFLLRDLKREYDNLSEQFRMFDPVQQKSLSARDFLIEATRPKGMVLLQARANTTGILKPGQIELDLSAVGIAYTGDWDKYRLQLCSTCRSHGQVNRCEYAETQAPGNRCAYYNPILKDSKGKLARSLRELIEEITPFPKREEDAPKN